MLLIAIGAFIFFLIKYSLLPDPVPILGIYSQPGKWYRPKFDIMRFLINRRQKQKNAKKSRENLKNSQFGGDGGERDIGEMERRQESGDGEWEADAVFFDASNKNGWYFTLGTAQRPNNIINLFFVLRIPDVGTFVNEEVYTDTNVPSIDKESDKWITKSGFVVTCVEPMKKWRIEFNGKLANSIGSRIFENVGPENRTPDELIDAHFDLTWTHFGEHFDFDTMCSPTSIAHSLAIEPWSRELFDRLKSSHQTHYEQFGFLEGSYTINSKTYENIRMTSMRDHTIAAYRRWTDIRRYIMMIYHLEDGTCINTSVISMPGVVFSQLEFGYIVTPEGKTISVDRVHFSLPNHGEDKKFPNKFHYSFEAAGNKYEADVFIKETVSFKMGLEQACQVNENMSEFVVNGQKGWGFAEVEYRIQPY